MSMPTIPDITPKIDITLEDSINLLLSSIAMEENSLSRLMDAERDKILFVLDTCKNKESTVKDALDINESVNDTIKTLIKMQMLLQFKLENVSKLIPSTSTGTSTSTTTCSTTSTTSTSSSTTKCPKRDCCLKSKSCGVVSNKSDEFHNRDVVLNSSILPGDLKENSIYYYVGHDNHFLSMEAYADVKIKCSNAAHPEEIKVWGSGRLIKGSVFSKTYMNVKFKLLVYSNNIWINEFKMIIESSENMAVIHDSGSVNARRCY